MSNETVLPNVIPPLRKRNERGVVLLLGTLTLPVLVSMMGLAIDASMLYSVRSKLQLAVDGASLAAARALSIGLTTLAQTAAAQANATNWFNRNFPSGTIGTSSIVLDTPLVFDDPDQPLVRHVVVTAHASAPSYFMRFWGSNGTNVNVSSDAARRDAVVTMVLDRSASMNTGGAGDACTLMRSAAKQFTGLFAAGRDRIGLVTFNMASNIASAPVTTFKTVLGYTDASGSGSGLLDNIVCNGGTGTPQATIVGYNELYKVGLPGALNVVLVFTDGEPNVVVLDFRGGQTTRRGTLEDTTSCDDSNNDGLATGSSPLGHLYNNPPSWTSGRTFGSGSYLSNVPAGPIGAVFASSSSTQWAMKYSSTSVSSTTDDAVVSNPYGCSMGSGSAFANNVEWIPDNDVFGTALELPAFYSLNRSTHDGASRLDATNYNIHYGAYNASANAASRARTARLLPDGRDFPGAYVYCIGLGNVNHALLQRMANDPNPDPAGYYSAFTGYDTTQPIGSYVYAPDSSRLSGAFVQMASFILRLAN